MSARLDLKSGIRVRQKLVETMAGVLSGQVSLEEAHAAVQWARANRLLQKRIKASPIQGMKGPDASTRKTAVERLAAFPSGARRD